MAKVLNTPIPSASLVIHMENNNERIEGNGRRNGRLRMAMMACDCGDWDMQINRWYDADGNPDLSMLDVKMECLVCGSEVRCIEEVA